MLVRIDELQLEIIKSQLVESHTSMNGLKPELSSQAVAMQRVNSFTQLFTLLKRLMGFTDEINKPVNAVKVLYAAIDFIQNICVDVDSRAAQLLSGEYEDFEFQGLPNGSITDGILQGKGSFCFDDDEAAFFSNFITLLNRDLFYEFIPNADGWFDPDGFMNTFADICGIAGMIQGEALYDGVASGVTENWITWLTKTMDGAFNGTLNPSKYKGVQKLYDSLTKAMMNPNSKLYKFWSKNGSKFTKSLTNKVGFLEKLATKNPAFKAVYKKFVSGGASANGWAAGMGAAVIIDSLIDNFNINKEYAQKLAEGLLSDTQAAAGALGEKVGSFTINALEGIFGTMGCGLGAGAAEAAGASAAGATAAGMLTGIGVSVIAAIELDMITARFSTLEGDSDMRYNSFADLVGDTFISADNMRTVEQNDRQFVADMEYLNAQREAMGLEPIEYDATPTSTPSFLDCLQESWDNLGENLWSFWTGK